MHPKVALFGAGGLVLATALHAESITFIHEGVGTGTLDGVGFLDADFRITGVGDTDDRLTFGAGWWIGHDHASIWIEGVGTSDFLVPTRSFVNNGVRIVGFSRSGGDGADLFLGPNDDELGEWFMESGFGPIEGTGSLVQWEMGDIMTTGGLLVFKEEQTTARFAATIPAPGALWVMSVGAICTRRRCGA
jgi:hypothetical protein